MPSLIDLVFIMKNDVFTNSKAIADGVGHSHETVVKLLKNSKDLEQFSDLKSEKFGTKGRPLDVYFLNEEQATLLIMLMKNTPKVRKFKSNLAKEFFKQRRIINALLAQKQNAEWLEARSKTKCMRKELTDVIQEFVLYAKNQGSKSAEKYYLNFSRMELTGLFIIEERYPNARDVMSIRQLNLIELADEAIANSLKESMANNLNYKDCYKAAKEKIELLARIIPRSPLPALLEKSSL